MDGWRRCISEPSPDSRAQMEISITRDFPCHSTVKGLSPSLLLVTWLSDKKLNSILHPSPLPAIARSIDPSLHLIIQRALHYPNYLRRVPSVLDFIDPFRCPFWFFVFLLIKFLLLDFYKSTVISARICSDSHKSGYSYERNIDICRVIQSLTRSF